MIQDQLHAMQVRLQVAENALHGVAVPLTEWWIGAKYAAIDKEEIDQMRDQIGLVQAALAILRGVKSDIPDALKMGTIREGDEAVLRRVTPQTTKD